MMRLRKYMTWFLMCTKRLLYKASFIVLLCTIVAIIPLTNTVLSQGDGGVLKIVLCAESDDEITKKAMDTLLNKESIVSYSSCENRNNAIKLVREHKVDAAWIFAEDISGKIDENTRKKTTEKLVRIVQREDTVPLKIAREMLYASLYKDISFATYKNFIYEDYLKEDIVSQSELKEKYENTKSGGDIIKLSYLNSETKPEKKSNLLTAPIRGILSVLVVLCTMAAALYFLKDQAENKYAWLSYKKRLAPAFATCFSASVFTALVAFISMQFTGITTTFLNELVAMALLSVSSAMFCLVLCSVFKSPGKLGAAIGGIVIVMMVLCPIFFNVWELKFIKLLLPTYYYLNSVFMPEYVLYTVIYCVVMFATAYVINHIKSKFPVESLPYE